MIEHSTLAVTSDGLASMTVRDLESVTDVTERVTGPTVELD